VRRLLSEVLKVVPASRLAGHFHDTYGQAIANVIVSYEMGIRTFDSSIAGLGGCPFAKGAKGNLATEDLVYTMQKMGYCRDIDLDKLVSTGTWISQKLQIQNGSRAGAALASKSVGSKLLDLQQPIAQKPATLLQSTNEYRISRRGANIEICLTRAKNGNALTCSMIKGLTSLFKELHADTSVFHIVLTAEGRYFCTGMDLKDVRTPQQRFLALKDLFEAIDNCPQTTIAAVNGPCFGGGVGLVSVCDIRIFTSNTILKLTEVQLGLCPATISKYVIREWGVSFAREAMLTARDITANELAGIHFVHSIVENEKALPERVEKVLDNLRFAAPRAATLCKDLIRSAWIDAGHDKQAQVIQGAFTTMMIPGSESTHALSQFKKGNRGIDWELLSRKERSNL